MPEIWLYYIPIVVQREGKVGLTAKMVELDHAINSPEAVITLIESLTEELAPDEIEEGTLPVVPLTWTLITAKQGPGVKDNGDTH
jgi:hypothetical protein